MMIISRMVSINEATTLIQNPAYSCSLIITPENPEQLAIEI